MILFLFRNDGIGGESRLSFFVLWGFVVLLYCYYIFIILFLSSFGGSYLLQKADFKIDILSVLKIYFLSIFKIYLTAILNRHFIGFRDYTARKAKFYGTLCCSRRFLFENFLKIYGTRAIYINFSTNFCCRAFYL